MQYQIRLKFDYAYGGASDHARNLLHVLPAHVPDSQRLTMHSLTITPQPDERREVTDFFGNVTTMIAFHRPIGRFALVLDAKVERLPPPAVLDLSPPLALLARELADERRIDATSPHHFVAPSAMAAADDAIAAFARSCLQDRLTALQIVQRIGKRLHQEMKFDPDATHVDTPVAEAFACRHGVCQDFSHIMIAALRSLGMPAAYVSGFLRTIPPEGEARLEGADAMHAWVRAWCGSEMGWVDFDPTNDLVVGQDHVVVALGRDYADVAPVRGTMRSSGRQLSSHSVDMSPL